MDNYSGSCGCGRIRIAVRGGIRNIIHCHCSRCRKFSGSAYATNGSIDAAGLQILTGAEFLRVFEMGNSRQRHFCGICGSAIYHSDEADPARLRLRLGILDSEIEERPIAHIFVSSRACWEDSEGKLPRYDGIEPGR